MRTSKKGSPNSKKRVIARTYDEAICVFDIIRLLRYLAMTMMFDFLDTPFVCLCLAFKEFIFCEAMFFAIELTRFFEINVLKTECGCTIDLSKELACIYII